MLAAIFLTLAAILDNSNTACEEAEKQKKNSDLDGSLATVQIYMAPVNVPKKAT